MPSEMRRRLREIKPASRETNSSETRSAVRLAAPIHWRPGLRESRSRTVDTSTWMVKMERGSSRMPMGMRIS